MLILVPCQELNDKESGYVLIEEKSGSRADFIVKITKLTGK